MNDKAEKWWEDHEEEYTTSTDQLCGVGSNDIVRCLSDYSDYINTRGCNMVNTTIAAAEAVLLPKDYIRGLKFALKLMKLNER